ncbi:hypothetical protein BS47DRAFT_1366771 [Hydnum rufescens UP504]|uniref:Uncharacterized protein n=1 Tax=Hydnum rufescens UP504 TaxID=1448309 RepID=A0A9P6DQC9_9AGAM|nr:hypothetical protein BS47DRAFT_1366771 [Hydnum rufescens UP504]
MPQLSFKTLETEVSFQGWSLLTNRIKTGGDIREILKDSVEHEVKSTWRVQFASDKRVLIVAFWAPSFRVDPIKNEGYIREILLESMGIAPVTNLRVGSKGLGNLDYIIGTRISPPRQ